jgi:DNA-binding NarL/FixJ family response regulator
VAIKSLFNGAILYCSRADVKEAVRGELKRVGVSKIETAANYDEAVEKINQNASFLLVIDWDQNPLDAVKILESTRTDQKIDSRPILLIAKGMSTQIVAAAYEYNVSQAHSGEVSQKIIAELLREIAKQEENNAPLRKVFQRISQLKSVKEWDTAISILEEMLNRLPQNDRVAVELAEIYIAQNRNRRKILGPPILIGPPRTFGFCILWGVASCKRETLKVQLRYCPKPK